MKKTILALIIIIETVLGSLFLINYHKKKIIQTNALEANKVAIINKKEIIYPDKENLKHYWEFNSNSSYEEKPDWLPNKASYNINDDGLNDRFDYQIEKPNDIYRIITLGDSYTFGHFISTPNNWTEKLEDLLNESGSICGYDKFEVINLGMPGYDVQYITKKYLDVGKKYNPDLILWFESGSGFLRFQELSMPMVENCEKDHSEESLNQKKQHYYYCYYKANKHVKENYQEKYLDNILYSYFSSFFESIQEEKMVIFYYQKTWSKNNNAMIEKLKNNYPSASFETIVPIPSDEEKLPDAHPNIKGHETISQSIFEYLITKKIQCQKSN